MSRILLSGTVAALPGQGGAAWTVLHYLVGLQRLGHDVYFVESLPASALQPTGSTLAASANAAYFQQVMREFGFGPCSALLLEGTRQTLGLDYAALRAALRDVDLLINLSGQLKDRDLSEPIPTRAYLDLDPSVGQRARVARDAAVDSGRHTHWVTTGLAVGQPECAVPTGGLSWLTTLPPVVLDAWPVRRQFTRNALTTIADWPAYAQVDRAGGQERRDVDSLRQLIDLPTRIDQQILVTLATGPGPSDDLDALERHGWRLVDPARVVGTPAEYRRFIQRSWAELGIAERGHVESRSGAFSDRSARYLASGRPVIAQDTGFSRFLPTGKGLFAFDTPDDVVMALRALRHDYETHARAARAIAEEHFDSDKVLGRLLPLLGVTASAT